MTFSRQQAAAQLEAHGLNPSRALGQNFVVDPNTVRRISRLAGVASGDHVVEIGPGLGALTMALAETGARVVAVEVDRHLIEVLRTNVEPLGVQVVHGDAMHADWSTILAQAPSWSLVANLPYNISTPLIADLLDSVPQIERFLVMVQREVGERLAATPGTKAYGAVSVKVAYWATATLAGAVPRTVFLPRPNVDSVLVRIERRAVPAVDPTLIGPGALFELVRLGFSKRRKMLRGALAGACSPEAFAAAGVAPTARAEELDVHAWGRLAVAARG